ncbi:predicted protein [Plenodomus lingam JN3]|uniref:Predicted protein n=1 Tax=Leptosphaeria maculans (strain JN3 / isolate v23.1.3 / race Av1-4-5-6-7-8) TaxID=985895 RepID=E4ZNX1_LEPMJ|nr:predicted protein [Plenodomus lingam JN3]CBX93340.1 predicted protein [Plenodomus lingam JN3]
MCLPLAATANNPHFLFFFFLFFFFFAFRPCLATGACHGGPPSSRQLSRTRKIARPLSDNASVRNPTRLPTAGFGRLTFFSPLDIGRAN